LRLSPFKAEDIIAHRHCPFAVSDVQYGYSFTFVTRIAPGAGNVFGSNRQDFKPLDLIQFGISMGRRKLKKLIKGGVSASGLGIVENETHGSLRIFAPARLQKRRFRLTTNVQRPVFARCSIALLIRP
jgi:hypothetical protein